VVIFSLYIHHGGAVFLSFVVISMEVTLLLAIFPLDIKIWTLKFGPLVDLLDPLELWEAFSIQGSSIGQAEQGGGLGLC
jgi:hypothetical protein